MKTFKATTARILLLCLIFIEQNVAEPTARHNVAHHQDTARRHHAPSGIQAPHKLAPSSSKVYCISADSNIYEILHKANTCCRGNDFKCTFYHYSDHKYHNLGTIDVNRELFDNLLAKYENWLMTSEPIEENNGKDSNHKVRLKGSGNTLYSTYIIDEKTPDKANRNVYDNNVLQDTSKLDKHYRRHKAKLTGDQKTRYINGERVSVDPKFNKQQKYYEVFLPKDKHRGDPRTIYVDIDGDKENTEKELRERVNDKPIKVQLNEYSSTDEGKFAVHDKHNRKDVYRHHSNEITRTEDIEETSKYQSQVADIKLGDNDKMVSHVDDTDDENTEDDDDKLHRIHLVETNKHHNDLSADNFTYKRTNTVQLNEPVFHVENPRNRNNMHIFSLPDYTGHHSDIISDYTGYKDIHLLPNLPDDEDVPSILSNYDISLSDATEKESPITLYTNPNLQAANDNLLPGHINYYSTKVTHGTPFSSQSGSSPIVSSSSETAAVPKYSPFDIALRSSPYSGVSETLTPCNLKTLSQGTISSSPSPVLSNEDKYKIDLLSSPFEATKSFADSSLFKTLPSVTPETTYFSQPSDVTMPVDASTFLNNLPTSFESLASYPSTATMPSPLNSKLGPEICQLPQIPYTSPYSKFSPPNLGLLNHLQQNNNFGKPMFNQNNMFSQPPRDIFDIKINPFMTRPPFSYSYAEPFNPTPSYLSSPGSVINSSPSAYTNSILNGNRIPGTVSNSFLHPSAVNQMSPLSLRQQRPNYYSPPCPKPAGTSPYNNVSPLNLENYQIADNLALNANVEVQDFLSPIQNTPLSVLDHPYRTTPSNYIRPTQANIFSTSAPNQAKPIVVNALENQLLETQGEISSYSELAHITEKPCLNLQNEPLVSSDASLIGNHLLELSPTKPIVSNTDINISDSSIDSELNKLTPLDFSLVNPDSDTIHIQLNTTINLNQEPQPDYELNLTKDSNLIPDSSLSKLDVGMSPCTAVDNNKPSINVTTTINIESEETPKDEAGIPEFDSSLIGTDLPISSEDSIITKVDTENLTEDSSLTDFIQLEQSDKNVERELNKTVNIKQESKQTDIEYPDINESILPHNLTEQELKVDIGPQPLDSTLIDLESDNITETVAQEFETVDGPPNVNVTVCEPDINLSVQTNIDLKPEAENPQLLETPTGSTIDITINTSVNITDNNLNVLEPELVETKPNEKPITTNKETEFIPLDVIHTKDKETINEFEAGEFIPAFTSGMNIPAEDITAEILPNNELNSSLVGPNLDELKEEPGIASTELDFTADLIGPTLLDINETLNDVPSKVVELDSSLIKPISGKPTIRPCIEPLEVSGLSDIENLDSGVIKESDIVLSSDPLTFESSLIGPSLINDTIRLETQPPKDFQEIIPTSESPTINFESKLLGPSLLPHKDSLNIESSLVGPSLDQVIIAPEEISNSEVKLNFSSNLIGPNLIIDADEPDLLRKLEAGTKMDDGKPGPIIVDGKPLVEESVPYSEYQLDASLIGPDLSIKIEPKPHLNIIAKTNEVKPGFDQTNSVILDSSLIDNLLDTEKNINGPNGPSIVSSANILSSDLKREGLPLEADISLICPNPAVKPKYEELPSLPPSGPKISFSHDLIGPGLSKLNPEISLPNPYITQEGMPVVSNGFLEELKPTTYSKLPDLYLPATPFKSALQHSLPCENLFTPSPLPSSLLNNRLPASVLNLPSNMLSQLQSPLYASTIPYSPFSPSPKYSPLHNLPHSPFSNPYLKPEYLQSVKNPLVLNALLNNPHLKDALSSYSLLQPPESFEQIGLPCLPNFQNLPYQYLQAINGIPFNMQPLKSNIPCASQTKTPLSSTEINWQELESLPVEVQNTPVKPAFKPVKNETPITTAFSPIQTKESESLFDHQNYHMIESELNKFIQEDKNDNKLGNYETFEEPPLQPCEKVKYLPEDNVEKYIAEATTFVEPMNVAKEQVNLKETEFIKLEPELHFHDAIDAPRNLPPKYKPKVEEHVFYQPVNEADILKDYQLLEPKVDTQIQKLPSTDQFYPYEMLPEPLALPVKPASSPLSYAKTQISPLLSPPCLQEYTSVPASEYLPSSNLRPMPTSGPSRPSKTYASSYLPEYSSPSYIDTYNIPKEDSKLAMPYTPCESYASPNLPTYSNAPLFETGIPIESSNPPISALSKELPILLAPSKPSSSTLLTPTEFMSPSYYSPSSTAYTDSSFINPANILTEPSSFSSASSGLPCLKPLPETNPIFRELMANPQLMNAMNLPMANNIFPWNSVNRKPTPFMLPTPNYLPYQPIPITMDNLIKNEFYKSAIESNLQKLKDAPTELWTTHDETNSYAYSNDSGTKLYENIVPENHLETVPYTLDSEKYPKLMVKEDVISSPIETLSYATVFSKPKPVTQSVPIKMDSSKKNELSAPTLELNSQKLETAPSEISTNYDEKSNYIYTNDSGTKIHEDIVLESHLETVPYTLESKENIKVKEAPTSNFATESKLNHGRPVSYSQVKEAEYYKPIVETPQTSDMQWLPLSSAEYSPNSSPGLSKPCPKLSPFTQSPYLQALPHFPSFLPSSIKGSPYNNKLDSLPYSSSPYYPASVEEYAELLTTAPFRNHTPLLPMKSNVLENIVPFEGAPYLASAVSSPYTRLPSPTSYLPSEYESNMTPFGLQLAPPTAEQLKYVPPITEGPSPIEYTPVQSPINALPSKSMKPIPCPSTTSALPIQNGLPLPGPYESYAPQPGLKYPPEYQSIYEPLPSPVPLKESPVYYEPASSPRLIKSPNIVESLPFTMSSSSEDIRRPASDNLSPINYASYTSPIEEYLEASPSLPCKPLMKPSSLPPKPQPQLPVDEYTILPSSSEATPFETYSSYETKPYSQDIPKPSPKSKPGPAKYLPLDDTPYQIIDQPYTPVNKVQTPSNLEYILESSPLLKQLLAPPFKGYNSLPYGSNVKLPYLPPTYMPLDMINTLPPALTNPFIKSELKDNPTPLSVPTNEITSTPKESSSVSDISSLDNYEEYIEPCPLPKLIQSSSLIKPLITPIKALPELMKEEIPIEFENVFASSADIPQYISPTNSLLKQLIGNAYNSPLFLPQNDKQKSVPSEIESTKLSTHEPIICNIDQTSSPNAPIVSELPDMKPCDFKAPLFDQYQSLPTEKISPITMTPLSTTKSPFLTSSYQEISPIELAETLPISSVRPTSSSLFNPPNRPPKLNLIPMKYGPKSIVEYLPDINNICPSEMPLYIEPATVEATPYAPKPKNVKQIQLDGFPIAELFAKAPKILAYNPLSKIELPKTSEYQNIPKDSSDWVLINNDNMADKTNGKLNPCEYTQTTKNPAEAEYLKLAKLLENKKPKTEFEKYSELIEENQYEKLPTNLLDFNVCKDVYKLEHIGINLPQKPQNSATFDNFYANNHIGASPLICLIDPRRESKNIKPIIDAKLSYNEISPDIITYLDENLSGNIDLPTDSDYNFITPNENLRSVPVSISPIEGSPISIDSKYLDKPTSKSPQMKYGPNPVEYAPEQYYYPPKDNIDDIKYSGYKTYQLPTQKLTEKSSNIPLETYYPDVPFSAPKSSIPYSYIPTISPETYIPEYETLKSPLQAKSDLKVQPQSPIYNNYNPIDEVTVKPDNFDKNDEIKNCIINYINSKGLKDKLYTNNEEITIPIGNIAIVKREPHTAKILPTNNPSIGLKVWQSNVKLVKAELKFKTNEVSVYNFMPILNNLNEYDIQEIRKIIKKYIDDKYGNHIEVNEPYTIDNQYTVIQDLNRNENEKYNLLWPTYYV